MYMLWKSLLEVSLKDNDGNAIKGAADRIATVINGAERPRLISVGDFSEVSSGVYHTMAKIMTPIRVWNLFHPRWQEPWRKCNCPFDSF